MSSQFRPKEKNSGKAVYPKVRFCIVISGLTADGSVLTAWGLYGIPSSGTLHKVTIRKLPFLLAFLRVNRNKLVLLNPRFAHRTLKELLRLTEPFVNTVPAEKMATLSDYRLLCRFYAYAALVLLTAVRLRQRRFGLGLRPILEEVGELVQSFAAALCVFWL